MDETIEIKEEIVEVEVEQLPEKVEDKKTKKKKEKIELPKKAKVARILAIVAFSIVMSLLGIVFITDITIFGNQIIAMFEAIVGGGLVFLYGIVLWILSIVLIFGIVIMENYGFWPVTWASQVYHEALAGATPTEAQIKAEIAIRIIVLILAFACFVLSIVSLAFRKRAKKENPGLKQPLTTVFDILTIVLAISGIFVALTVIILTGAMA